MTSAPASTAVAPHEAPVSARWALGLCTVVSWFFVTAAAFATGPLQALPWLIGPQRDMLPNAALIAVLGVFAVLAFLASLLPLGARWGREVLVARSAFVAVLAGALLGTLMAAPVAWHAGSRWLILAMTVAVVATAAGALFLNAAIGLLSRRSVAGGLVLAILLRHVVRLLPLHSALEGWNGAEVFMTVVLGAAGLLFLTRWRGAPSDDRADSFERRAGGLRLRGALAFGVLLFFELTYGLPGLAVVDPPGAGRLEGALAGAVGLVPLAFGWLFVVRGLPVPRHRFLAVALSVVLVLGALFPFWSAHDYWMLAAAAVLAQCAAFMLFGRAMAPASGRRSGRKLATGLALFLLLTIAHAATLVTSGDAAPVAHGGIAATLVTLVAGAVLAVAMYLTPRPVPAPPPLSDRWLFGMAAALVACGLIAALA